MGRIRPSQLCQLDFDIVIIASIKNDFIENIESNLHALGIPAEKIRKRNIKDIIYGLNKEQVGGQEKS